MRRAALICGIVAVLLLADGIYMEVSNYQPGDQNAFTGNPNIVLSDGQVVLISGGLLLLATVVMWLAATRKGSSH
jgi:cell division protein FtsX